MCNAFCVIFLANGQMLLCFIKTKYRQKAVKTASMYSLLLFTELMAFDEGRSIFSWQEQLLSDQT